VADRRQFTRCLLAALAGMAIIHIGGWAQLALLTGAGAKALVLGVTPFIPQDLLKVVIATVVLWRGHHALRLNS
jgi:biotin transporter BioY